MLHLFIDTDNRYINDWGSYMATAVKIKSEEYVIGDHIVYPAHGVGKIIAIEQQIISTIVLDLLVIIFDKDKMTLRVPFNKAEMVGIRRLASDNLIETAMNVLKGKPRSKKAMWSRRAQEYEAKINSGNPVAIAEVVRDLHRTTKQGDQSYSERQIYESAFGRLVREIATIESIAENIASARLEKLLKAELI